MRFALLLSACVACGSPAPRVVSIPRATPAPTATIATAPPPRVAVGDPVVVTNGPYGALALWRPHEDGRIDRIPFPWAELSNVDTLTVAPNGREVAYVEGGSLRGPLLVRELTGGSKTLVAPHAPGRALEAVAFSPSGRKLLYAERSAKPIPSCSRGIRSCLEMGPRSYRVYDRERGTTTERGVALGEMDEIAGLLDSGELLVSNEDGALERIDPVTETKTAIASGGLRHSQLSMIPARGRLLSCGWDERTHTESILSLDLATWNESAIASHVACLRPAASPSGDHVAWLETSYPSGAMSQSLVLDGRTLVAPTYDLVGFTWVDDAAIVAHYRSRLDVLDARDGAVKGSLTTNADDTMP